VRNTLDRLAEPALRAVELFGQALPVGDVAGGADHADGAAFLVTERKAMLARPAPLAVAAPVANFAIEALGLAAEMLTHRSVVTGQVFWMNDIHPMSGGAVFLGIEPHVPDKTGRVIDLVGIDVPVVPALADRFGRELVALLALFERPLGLDLVGD